MPNHGAPAAGTLPPHYTSLAELVAQGHLSLKDIAARFNMTPDTLRRIRHTPLFKALVAEKTAEINDELRTSFLDTIIADGPTNVRFLRDVRDGKPEVCADLDTAKVRLQASGMLLDRQAPRRSEQSTDIGVTVRIDGAERAALEAVAREAIDVPFAPVAEPTPAIDEEPRPVPLAAPAPQPEPLTEPLSAVPRADFATEIRELERAAHEARMQAEDATLA